MFFYCFCFNLKKIKITKIILNHKPGLQAKHKLQLLIQNFNSWQPCRATIIPSYSLRWVRGSWITFYLLNLNVNELRCSQFSMNLLSACIHKKIIFKPPCWLVSTLHLVWVMTGHSTWHRRFLQIRYFPKSGFYTFKETETALKPSRILANRPFVN